MSQDFFSWLHLTDFHYGLKGQDCLWPTLREPFLDSLATLHDRCGPWHAVLFTGDLVQSGESAQFEKMQAEVLAPLWHKLRELGSGDAVLLAVPGNHDLYRPNPLDDDPAAERLLEEGGFERIEARFWDNPGGSYRRVVNNAFAAYSKWWNDAPYRLREITSGILPGDFAATIETGHRHVGIVGLNTTFLQLGAGDYEGRLVWDARQLDAVCEGSVDAWSRQHDAALLLTHQGPNWLTPAAARHGETEIAPAGRFAIHLYGHQHETEITYVSRGGSRNAVRRCQGCSVFGMEKFGDPPQIDRAHGYAAGRLEFGREPVLRLWPRIATSKLGPWRFIPDHEHAVLLGDEGTEPEPVATRARSGTAAAASASASASAHPTTSVGSPDDRVPHSTLPSRRPFFGRSKDLERIAKYLLPEDRSWGVVLDGPGGVGKTALALEAAHRAPAEHFPLKLWITAKNRELLPTGEHKLTDHSVGNFHAMLNELGRALGRDDIAKAVPNDRPALVRHTLTKHRALLVLDNLETFSPEERRRVFELLSSLPAACRGIVTSRRRTDGSTAAHHIRLDKLERDAADELLAEFGRRWAPVARLTQDERDRLYAETGGNPLLLTWTAGQLGRTTGRSRTVDDAIERLKEAHRLQQLDQSNDPLDYVFGDLVATFTDDETAVLAALVHFSQPAPIEWLVPLAEISTKAAEMALDGLRDRALLVEDEFAGTWLLPPLAARFLRRSRPEAVGISGERLADRASALALENGFDQHSRFPILEAAWPQLAAALPMLIGGDNRRLQQVCFALARFLEYSGRWDDRIALFTAAEAKAVRAKDFRSAGRRAYEVGWIFSLRNESAEVLKWAERAAGHWAKQNVDIRERSRAISLRGISYLIASRLDDAVATFREALDVLQAVASESNEVAVNLYNIAVALRRLGKWDEAELHYIEALDLAKHLDDKEGIASCTSSLAQLALDRQQWPEAEELAREALNLAEKLGRRFEIATNSRRMAVALAHQDRREEARPYAERAVAIFENLRAPQLRDAQSVLATVLA